MTTSALLIIFCTCIIASLYGSSAGGGSLLILPTLLFLGVEPHTAVASSLIGYTAMCMIGIHKYHAAGKIDWRIARETIIAVAIGAATGAYYFPAIEAEFLKKGISVAIIVMVVVLLLTQKGLNKELRHRRHELAGLLLLVFIGFYGVTISAGAGILTMYVLVFFFGLTFLECSGTLAAIFLVSNIVASSINYQSGLIDWPVGLTMFAGIALGSWVGIHYALKKGDKFVRMLLIPVVALSALKMLI